MNNVIVYVGVMEVAGWGGWRGNKTETQTRPAEEIRAIETPRGCKRGEMEQTFKLSELRPILSRQYIK